ncbi:hypothetical protein NVI2019_PEGOAJLN_02488 [Providencia alcalifaciens]|nr:hypothetical protein NVI2019_PLFLNFOB_01158 [Providencia alcalifaciens]CAG9422388.1 hypothetical protein NVI2019_OHEONHNH_02163 [Providencia alcalifaciens]CAG9425326.1 hypothetical protein NVI2019_PEGOAJLN_02488 [Providencia alcalifaciens]CAG9426394.1 hypothetical protein NVI2019_KOLGMIGM_02659 [Providencia alcalifaciens]CAG9427440.1 hypothetical protein NVI2019_OGMBKCAO_02659 [Providencia alcalifaciens]
MNAKQKYIKQKIFALLRESDMTDKQIDELVADWKFKQQFEKTNRILRQVNSRGSYAFT